MRITVNLSIYFHDHRCLAKIFIDKKKKFIKDVEQHIADIFQIQDFYLKCENQYLPPTESVEVLDKDDLVWVIPKEEHTVPDVVNEAPREEFCDVEKKKKKKKKRLNKDELNRDNNNEQIEIDIVPVSKSKKQKIHKIENGDYEMDTEDLAVIQRKKKKKNDEVKNFNATKEIKNNEQLNVIPESKSKKQKPHKSENGDYEMETEDLAVIQKKNESDEFQNFNATKEIKNIEQIGFIPDSKSKKQKPQKTDTGDYEMETEDLSTVAQKKKKHYEVKDFITTKEIKNNSFNSKEEKSLEINSAPHAPEDVDSTIISDSLKSNKCEDASINDQSVDVKSLVHKFEDKKTPSSPRVHENIINNQNMKKINIIKTIIISNGISTPNNVASNEVVAEKQDSDFHCNKKSTSPMNELGTSEILSNAETSSTCCSDMQNINDPIKKRKRTRTRKRKNTAQNNVEISTTFSLPDYKCVSKLLDNKSSKHIRFSDVSLSPIKAEVSAINEAVLNTDVTQDISNAALNKNEIQDISNDEVIMINDTADLNLCETNCNGSTSESKLLQKSYSEKEIEECIQHPITQNIKPKLGDTIAFKIFRMSENYTPEISSTIVGKVLEYNTENQEITFNILYGREQCLEPQGKFSLESDEQPFDDNYNYHCSWSKLLEPRLIL